MVPPWWLTGFLRLLARTESHGLTATHDATVFDVMTVPRRPYVTVATHERRDSEWGIYSEHSLRRFSDGQGIGVPLVEA